MSATITVALYGDSHGFIIAVIPRQDPYHMGTSLVVGDVRKISADGEPELWRAWLWPLAGGNLPVTQSCKASDAASTDTLRVRLQKRADRDGRWWERDVLDDIDEAVARITDEDVEDSLSDTLRRAGYGGETREAL